MSIGSFKTAVGLLNALKGADPTNLTDDSAKCVADVFKKIKSEIDEVERLQKDFLGLRKIGRLFSKISPEMLHAAGRGISLSIEAYQRAQIERSIEALEAGMSKKPQSEKSEAELKADEEKKQKADELRSKLTKGVAVGVGAFVAVAALTHARAAADIANNPVDERMQRSIDAMSHLPAGVMNFRLACDNMKDQLSSIKDPFVKELVDDVTQAFDAAKESCEAITRIAEESCQAGLAGTVAGVATIGYGVLPQRVGRVPVRGICAATASLATMVALYKSRILAAGKTRDERTLSETKALLERLETKWAKPEKKEEILRAIQEKRAAIGQASVGNQGAASVLTEERAAIGQASNSLAALVGT